MLQKLINTKLREDIKTFKVNTGRIVRAGDSYGLLPRKKEKEVVVWKVVSS